MGSAPWGVVVEVAAVVADAPPFVEGLLQLLCQFL
jgi:hypothetical protein